jgi:hypothetical protein
LENRKEGRTRERTWCRTDLEPEKKGEKDHLANMIDVV